MSLRWLVAVARVLTLGSLVALGGHACSNESCRTTRTCPSEVGANRPDASLGPGVIGAGDGLSAGLSLCPEGEHLCAESCVSNLDPTSCGASCTPCEAPIDGVASCDGLRCGGACGPGKQLCAGTCIDAGTPCTNTCPEGTHECNGLCPSLQSVNACGVSCEPCQVPEGAAQATCTGQECSFRCAVGQHRCGDTCARDTDVRACGDSCSPCPAYENGFAACNDGTCTVWCNGPNDANPAGFHVCDEQCMPSDSPLSCGSSCEPCTVPAGGEATCVEGECGGVCPAAQVLCFGTCINEGATCEGSCPNGTHDCDGLCVLDSNATRCGEACVACNVPVGASGATCVDGACGISGCRPGFHQCGQECVVDDDATACGPTCVECAGDLNDANALPICRDDLCTLECDANLFHLCDDGACHGNDDTLACGANCTVCRAPEGGVVTCNGSACVASCPDLTVPKLCNGVCVAQDVACDGQCPEGTHNCRGFCVSDDDTDSCGTSCDTCPEPTSGSPTCLASAGIALQCGIECDPGFHACNDETCESDLNAAACGPSCELCPTPPALNGVAVGEPVCAGGACDVSCIVGYHQCGDTTRCAADTDATACGPDCVACTATTPVCFQGACRECDPAGAVSRRCDGNSPQFCSANGATLGTWVDFPTALCSDPNAVCDAARGTCDCATGFHPCGSTCVPDADATQCGAACVACPAPAAGIGNAACESGSCEIACASGDPACGNQCCPAAAPACNGTTCGVCATGATTRCDALVGSLQGPCTNRMITCANGAWPMTQCNGAAADTCGNDIDDDCNGSVDDGCDCGTIPDTVSVPCGACNGGRQTCNGGVLGDCDAPDTCGGCCNGEVCVLTPAASTCGVGGGICQVCERPAGIAGQPICVDGTTCGIDCDPDFNLCRDFDTGEILSCDTGFEGFEGGVVPVFPVQFGSARGFATTLPTFLGRTTTPTNTGLGALRMGINVSPGAPSAVGFSTGVCTTGDPGSLAGQTLSLSVFPGIVGGTALPAGTVIAVTRGYAVTRPDQLVGTSGPLTSFQWNDLSFVIPPDPIGDPVSGFLVYVSLGSTPFTGDVYFDDLQIGGQ